MESAPRIQSFPSATLLTALTYTNQSPRSTGHARSPCGRRSAISYEEPRPDVRQGLTPLEGAERAGSPPNDADAGCGRARKTGWKWSVVQLLVPVGSASLRREVVKVPDRFEGADVAGVLTGVLWGVEQFRAPEVADRLPVAVEHVQHGLLFTVRISAR